MRIRSSLLGIALAVVATVGGLAVPATSQAAYGCYDGAFCWYTGENHGGSLSSQFNYNTGWVALSNFADNNQSSYDQQFPDGCGVQPNTGDPIVWLSDTYYGQRWQSRVGNYNGDSRNTFNTVYVTGSGGAGSGWLNMNNKFNAIWNQC